MAQELLAVKLGEMDQRDRKALMEELRAAEHADAKMLQEEIEKPAQGMQGESRNT